MKNFIPRALFIIGAIISQRTSYAVEIYFSPSRDCENQIIQAIKNSTQEMNAVVYSVGNGRIVDAIIAAHKRGLKIRILTDRVQASGRGSMVIKLAMAGVNIRVNSKHKIEHNKFGVFDGKLAVNGSYNWTNPASDSNSENCAVMNETNAIATFKKRFEELWSLNSEAKSKVYLTKIMNKAGRIPASKNKK